MEQLCICFVRQQFPFFSLCLDLQNPYLLWAASLSYFLVHQQHVSQAY
jgi:hypothetical protein